MCSFRAGRNVALKQTAEQSSNYTPASGGYPRYGPGWFPVNSYVAGNAVDGRTGFHADITDIRSTCTHTDPDVDNGPGWWTVAFSQPVDIIWFLIYNRYGKIIGNLVNA